MKVEEYLVRALAALKRSVWPIIALGLMAFCQTAVADPRPFSVPAGDASAALRDFAHQAGLQFLYDYTAIKGIKTHAVFGRLEPETALTELLRGTGLQFEKVNGRTIVIRPVNAKAVGVPTTAPTPNMLAANGSAVEAMKSTDSTGRRPAAGDSETVDPAADAAPQLAEIIVTAERRKDNLQRVPISINAFSAETLKQSNITATEDLQIVTPGLSYATGLNTPIFFLRGIGTDDSTAGNESSVAVYVDGIYYPSAPGQLFSFNNIERIEVLKGPQGTLFGRNATGGLVQVVTKDPSQDLNGSAKVGYGNYNTSEATAYVTGGITHDLAADLSVYYRDQQNGWGTNSIYGNQVNYDREKAIRSKWLLNTEDGTKVSFAVDYGERHSDIGQTGVPAPGVLAPNGLMYRGSLFSSQSDWPVGGIKAADPYTKQGGLSLRVEHTFDVATLVSLSSYRALRSLFFVDQDNTPAPIVNATIDQHDWDITQELQLLSPDHAPFKWIVGAYYLKRHSWYNPFFLSGQAVDALGFPIGSSIDYDAYQYLNSYSGYAQATFTVAPRTDLTLGLRYTSDRYEFEDALLLDNQAQIVSYPLTGVTFNKPIWRVALNHQYSDDVMAYVSYNRGFKSGFFNLTTPEPPVGPETLDAYEAGTKWELLDKRLRINSAAYYYKYDGIQLQEVFPNGTGYTVNAAKAHIEGLEFEVTALPSKHLTLRLGGEWMPTAVYDSFPNAQIAIPLAGGGFNNIVGDASGTRMTHAPYWDLNASADLTVPTAYGELGLNVTHQYNSGFVWTAGNPARQGAYGLINAQGSWTLPDRKWTAQIWAKNVFNRFHVNDGGVGDVWRPAPPRTFGVSVEYQLSPRP